MLCVSGRGSDSRFIVLRGADRRNMMIDRSGTVFRVYRVHSRRFLRHVDLQERICFFSRCVAEQTDAGLNTMRGRIRKCLRESRVTVFGFSLTVIHGYHASPISTRSDVIRRAFFFPLPSCVAGHSCRPESSCVSESRDFSFSSCCWAERFFSSVVTLYTKCENLTVSYCVTRKKPHDAASANIQI